MAKNSHTHKLKRHRYKTGNEVFFCCIEDCSLKLALALALGKRSICWRCGEPFIMSEYSIRLAKPHCDSCHLPKGSKLVNTAVGENDKLVFDVLPQSKQTLSLSEKLTNLFQNPIKETNEEDI